MFVKEDSNELTTLQPTGPVLGPSPSAKFGINSINFSLNDVLLIYSDGVTDSMNDKSESFGEERLSNLLIKNKHLSPKEIVYSIFDELIKYSKNGEYSDDKTLVVVKRMP